VIDLGFVQYQVGIRFQVVLHVARRKGVYDVRNQIGSGPVRAERTQRNLFFIEIAGIATLRVRRARHAPHLCHAAAERPTRLMAVARRMH